MTQKVTVRPGAQPQTDQADATPSKQVVAQAANEVAVLDAAGRTIVLRKPNPLQKLRFIDSMGDSSVNPLWTSHVWPLMYVASIDGTTVPAPSQKTQIEALYQRLDEHGNEAVAQAFAEHFQAKRDEINEDLAKK
jgi:hypothetical protein